MFRMEASTLVEGVLEQLSNSNGKKTSHPWEGFKIKTPLAHANYTSISGRSDKIRAVFEALQEHISSGAPFGEEVMGNHLPKQKMGFYETGETPFGTLHAGRSRLVVRHGDLTDDEYERFRALLPRQPVLPMR